MAVAVALAVAVTMTAAAIATATATQCRSVSRTSNRSCQRFFTQSANSFQCIMMKVVPHVLLMHSWPRLNIK